jgi:hypothetical protein
MMSQQRFPRLLILICMTADAALGSAGWHALHRSPAGANHVHTHSGCVVVDFAHGYASENEAVAQLRDAVVAEHERCLICRSIGNPVLLGEAVCLPIRTQSCGRCTFVIREAGVGEARHTLARGPPRTARSSLHWWFDDFFESHYLV